MGEEGPTITVDLEPGETCVIKNIIVAHFGSNIANKFDQQYKDTSELMTANPKFLKHFELSQEMDWAIMVIGGNFILRNSFVSLKSLPENIKSSIPALVAMPESRLNILSTEFRGNESIKTAGAIVMNTDVLISDCNFHNFKAGACFLIGNNDTNIKISDWQISRCGIVGIYTQGVDCKPLILRNTIDNVEGPGIRVYKANRAKIKGCDISKSQTGIEATCCLPLLIFNKIYKNYENGILTIAKGGIRWDAIIRRNNIIK